MIPERDAIQKLEQVIARVDPRLVLDRGNVRAMTDPYPGLEYGLVLGEAAALLFMPEADLTASDWETRLFKRVEARRPPRARSAARPRPPAPPPAAPSKPPPPASRPSRGSGVPAAPRPTAGS